jgi:thiol-disulfide isomerase/thioredoxin
MRKILLALLLLPSAVGYTQIRFSIKIRFEPIKQRKHIVVVQSAEQRMDTIPYPSNNQLDYQGTISSAGKFQFLLDSSRFIGIWVDSIPLYFVCSEKKISGNYTNWIIDSLRGSNDAVLFAWFYKPDPAATTTIIYRFDKPIISTDTKTEKILRDSLQALYQRKLAEKKFRMLDSLIELYPNSRFMPEFLASYSKLLGRDSLALLYNKLPAFLQQSQDGQRIKKILDRFVLLKTGTGIDNFSMKDRYDRLFSLDQVKSKFILLDFWSSRCGPCRASNPALVKLYQQFRNKGLEIIGISLDNNKKDWLAAIRKDGLPWIHVSELNGWDNKIAKKYRVTATPFMILLDDSRKVIALPGSAFQLEKKLLELIQ